jgi:hypothetical protein
VHGGADDGVLAHAEIVVGAPYRHVADVLAGEMIGGGIGAAAAFEIGKDAVASLLVQRFKVLAEAGLVIHVS